MSALHGDIEEGVLANLLQYLALSQATGCLSLRHPSRAKGEVYLEGGRVVYVDADPYFDVSALSELMRWQRGRFSFRPNVDAPRRTLADSTERLLLEASTRFDTEPGDVAEAPLEPETVLAPRSSPEDGRSLVSLSALHVWRSLDGQRSLAELADASGLPLHIVVAGATELMQGGLAGPADEQLVDPAFVGELTREAIDILGPVAEVFVEDALFELGVEPGPIALPVLDDIITSVATQFRRSDWQLDFLRRVERLRHDYGLSA
ncbi:MAG: DUF4388 domain-containing protein [Deinococcales bacterium]